MNWEAHIEKVRNGYILTINSEDEENYKIKLVYDDHTDESSDRKLELEATRDLFYQLMGYFAVDYQKRGSHNIDIKIRKNKDVEQ